MKTFLPSIRSGIALLLGGLLAAQTVKAENTALRVEVSLSDFVQVDFNGFPVDGGLASPFETVVIQFTVWHDFATVLGSTGSAPTITGYSLTTTPSQSETPVVSVDYDPKQDGLADPNNTLYHNVRFPAPAGTLEYTVGFFARDLGGTPFLFATSLQDWTDVGGGFGASSEWVPGTANVTVTPTDPPSVANPNAARRQQLATAIKTLQKQIKAAKKKAASPKLKKLVKKLRAAQNQLRTLG